MFPSCYRKPADGGSSRSGSVAKLLLGVFAVYLLHSVWLLRGSFSARSCARGRGEDCITSLLAAKPRIQLSVFTCLVPDHSHLELAVKIDPFDPDSAFERYLNVSLPQETRNNGSLYAVVYVHRAGVSPLEDSREVHHAAPLTTFIVPTQGQERRDTEKKLVPVSHWRPRLSITIMSEDFTFSQAGLPSDLRRYMKVAQDGGRMIYLPLLLVNELHFRVRDLMEIGSSTLQLPLTVSYEGTSLRTFRFWVHLHEAVYFLRQFGFAEEFIEEIKETLSGSNLGVLAAAALLTAVQLVWEALALKNDIIAWRKKRSTVGISRTSILWRCLCSWLSFLHLLEETSLLVLLPVGLGACTEAWKVFKVFSIRRKASRLQVRERHSSTQRFELKHHLNPKPSSSKLLSDAQVKKTDDEERKTMEFDAQASRYLSYLVSPLCVGGAVLSLFYLRHRSVYSWLINTLVTGVYAFGFLSMAPQLFVNYKLASVSHLPTAVLVYRGANTLISDLGAGACFFSPSLCVSSSHGLSFFRDELLLFIHLYQRWCFSPKTRRRESATQSKKVKTH
ncbi:unnamed protein product [Tetraodon nigroviridis]|uniref:Lipid scramblase CLPTM1L n=1 Tax=Tetraodon nigroviridis TaxID=99883 RepID=Q4SH72_TETNG|nr:unnamed protein product [Tetraodon nigroviridis]